MTDSPPWVCPHCNFSQVLSPSKQDSDTIGIDIAGLFEGTVVLYYTAVGCANPKCLKLTFWAHLHNGRLITPPDRPNYYVVSSANKIAGMRFLPKGSSKSQPSYIPAPLVADYEEACAIRDLSPKAAATLVRRCLQGMIRDFCDIQRGTLAAEIKALREAVDSDRGPKGVAPETVDAIDHVRSIGNIGAHMEKDINVIVEVDANEAQMLIELVEMLFDEWYVSRHRRQERLSAITRLSLEKEDARKGDDAQVSPVPE